MAIQDIIKKRRLELNLTLKDVADALNVAESTVSRYETSYIANMKIDKLKALADVLQCTPGYLMGWEDENGVRPIQSYNPAVAELLLKVKASPELLRFVDHYLRLSKENQELVNRMVDNLMPRAEVKIGKDGDGNLWVKKSELTQMIKDALAEKRRQELLDSPYEHREQLDIDNQ